jgi:hypothetical protein
MNFVFDKEFHNPAYELRVYTIAKNMYPKEGL